MAFFFLSFLVICSEFSPAVTFGGDLQERSISIIKIPQVLSILLRNGAELDARDGFFHTPLHLACINGAVGCVKVLLENGADPSTKAQGGITPLQVT